MQKFVTKGSEGGSTGIHGLLKVGGGSSSKVLLFCFCLSVCSDANKQTQTDAWSDLSGDQNFGLDPLMLLATPVLEPDPDDPGV